MMSPGPFEIVVVSSDLERRRHLSDILIRQGTDPICVSTLRECRETLEQRYVALVFCDEHVSDGTFKDLLATYRLTERKPRLVVTSQQSDWEDFKEAVRSGAFDVIATPCRPTDVEWMLIQALREERRLAGRVPPRIAPGDLAQASGY